ncbi:hypothetical protein GCM10022223_19020 [Kineosporia mesophila]|uniref:Homeodomain-like domain-containing protein n=1 Tax=Kineosporia mesophila TaxID=566012 RepID=A0ABP6ZE44_9ACTN|nr:hypothetical protein [Kineosporia mesophila]MCD5353410.1 hypothetical protein [Kineosporia mesophila]
MSTTPHDTDSPGATAAPRQGRAWPVLLLALPAFVAIWSGWVELGRLTGFGPVNPLPGIWEDARINTAITLPIGVETYAAYAMWVWLGMDVGRRARTFARWSAIGSLALGAGGQVAYHLMAAAGMTKAPWPIVALVACLPVIVLGMGAALAHLVHDAPDTVRDGAERERHEKGTAEYLDHLDRLAQGGADQPAGAGTHPQPWPSAAEAWTEKAITETLIRERQHDQSAETMPIRPASVDQAKRSNASAGRSVKRTGRSNAEKARTLREKYPDWTVARIAERVGVTERTARRYLNAAPAPETAEPQADTGTEPASLAA